MIPAPGWPGSRFARGGRFARRRIVHPLLDFVLPTDCLACGAPLDALQRHGACSRCWFGLVPILRPCRRCGLPRSQVSDLLGPASAPCPHCPRGEPSTDVVRAAVVYDRSARSLLLRAKLERRPELLRPMADQLLAVIHAAGLGEDCRAIVPAPSHPWSRLVRGFSPAVVLGRRVSRRSGIPLWPCLLRRAWLPWGSSKRVSARQRRALVARSIRTRRRVPSATLLLVDDVMTTGSTLEACAGTLKSAGASVVRAAVWARTLPTDPGRQMRPAS